MDKPGPIKPRECRFTHHNEYAQIMPTCPKHGKQLYCGPFEHVCLDCEPFQGEPCGICGTARFACTC